MRNDKHRNLKLEEAHFFSFFPYVLAGVAEALAFKYYFNADASAYDPRYRLGVYGGMLVINQILQCVARRNRKAVVQETINPVRSADDTGATGAPVSEYVALSGSEGAPADTVVTNPAATATGTIASGSVHRNLGESDLLGAQAHEPSVTRYFLSFYSELAPLLAFSLAGACLTANVGNAAWNKAIADHFMDGPTLFWTAIALGIAMLVKVAVTRGQRSAVTRCQDAVIRCFQSRSSAQAAAATSVENSAVVVHSPLVVPGTQ